MFLETPAAVVIAVGVFGPSEDRRTRALSTVTGIKSLRHRWPGRESNEWTRRTYSQTRTDVA